MLILDARARGLMGARRADFAPKAIAKRFASALAMVEAYLRRVLMVMALELELTLVDVRKPLRRPHGRKAATTKKARFVVLERPFVPIVVDHAMPDLADLFTARATDQRDAKTPELISMTDLYKRLDLLASIAADPLVRAKRLAFHLARTTPGMLFAPDAHKRVPRTWTTEASVSYQMMAHDIETKSRSRPPPLLPLQRPGPSVLLLDG
jgi:hypothetical protein